MELRVAPPTPLECFVADCYYSTPPGIPTWSDIIKVLEIHSRTEHPEVFLQPGGAVQNLLTMLKLFSIGAQESEEPVSKFRETCPAARKSRSADIEVAEDRAWPLIGSMALSSDNISEIEYGGNSKRSQQLRETSSLQVLFGDDNLFPLILILY